MNKSNKCKNDIPCKNLALYSASRTLFCSILYELTHSRRCSNIKPKKTRWNVNGLIYAASLSNNLMMNQMARKLQTLTC